MNKYLVRLLFILIGGLFFWLSTQGRLSDFPFFDTLVYSLWGAVALCGIVLIGKRQKWWMLLLGLIVFQTSTMTFAQEVSFSSGTYTSYCRQAQQAKKNNWKGDQPCDATQWENARKYTAKNKGIVSKPTDDCSCSDTFDCAAKYMALCSNYESRHRLEELKNKEVHTVKELLELDDSGCWPCQMATVVFMVIQNLSDTLYSAMLEVAVKLLSLIFLGWLIFKGMSAVVFLGTEGMTYAGQVLIRFIAVALTVILLSSNGLKTLYIGLLNPFMDMGIALSQMINDANPVSTAFVNSLPSGPATDIDYCSLVDTSAPSVSFTKPKAKLGPNFRFATSYQAGKMDVSFDEIARDNTPSGWSDMVTQLLGGTTFKSSLSADAPTLLNDNMKAKLLCMTQKFYKQLRPFIALGQSLVEYANYDTMTILKMPTRIPNLKMYITGGIFILIFMVFSFFVAFRIMDVFLKLAFFLVMMPIFVVSVAFPSFRSFAAKGWTFLVHSVLEFVGLALAVTFVMQMFDTTISMDSSSLKSAMLAPNTEDYGKNLLNTVYGSGTCRVLFMMIAICYFGFCILQKVTPILDGLFGTSGIGGSLIGGMLLSKAQKAMNLTQKAGEVANNKNIRYKAPGSDKKADVDKLKKNLKAAKKEYEDKQNKANQDKKSAEKLKEKADKTGATHADKKKYEEAKKKAEESQRLADGAKNKMMDAQNQLDIAQKELSNARFENSTASFKPRRYAENAAKGLHYGSQWMADKVEGVGLKVGQTLNKTGIGSVLGVPIVAGTKAVSWGMRGVTKTASVAVHTATAAPGAIKGAATTVANVTQKTASSIKTGAQFSAFLAKKAYKKLKK